MKRITTTNSRRYFNLISKGWKLTNGYHVFDGKKWLYLYTFKK